MRGTDEVIKTNETDEVIKTDETDDVAKINETEEETKTNETDEVAKINETDEVARRINEENKRLTLVQLASRFITLNRIERNFSYIEDELTTLKTGSLPLLVQSTRLSISNLISDLGLCIDKISDKDCIFNQYENTEFENEFVDLNIDDTIRKIHVHTNHTITILEYESILKCIKILVDGISDDNFIIKNLIEKFEDTKDACEEVITYIDNGLSFINRDNKPINHVGGN